MSNEIAQEAVKAAAFVDYVRRHAPGLGSVAGFTSRLTEGMKDQAEKAGGASPFTAVFETVQDKAPGVAAAGFAHATGFCEYIVKEAPGVLEQVKDGAGDALDIIKTSAPGIFAAAQSVGESVGAFVSEQGPAVLDAIRSHGGTVLGFLSADHPDVLKGAMDGAAVAKDSAGAVAAGAAAVDLGDLQGAASAVHTGLSQAAEAVAGLEVDLGALKGAASAVSGAVSQIDLGALQGAAAVIGSGLSTAIGAIGGALDAETMAEATSTVMNIIGTGAAVFPFLLPLQIAMKDIGNAVQQATYNKEAAAMLSDRCTDCSKLVVEMAPKIVKLCKAEAEQEEMVKPFVEAIGECTEFLTAFSSKGFLSHMFRWKRDGRSLNMLDKKVSDTMQNLSMRVDGQQIDLQVANAEKLDEVFNMLKNASQGISEPSKVDPDQLAEIVRKAGAQSVEQVSAELQGVGFKLDEIAKTLSSLTDKFDAFADKVDVLAAEQKSRDEEMRNLILHGHAEARKHTELITLAAMKMMAEKGGQMIDEKYCTNTQLEYLAKRSRELRAKVPTMIMLHPHGIGIQTAERRDGDAGTPGPNGQTFPKGSAGASAHAAGADGEDGMDGEDGHDGQEAEDGLNGSSAEDFEVMIEFVSEDASKGTRKYRVEHAGPQGKDEHEIEVSLLNTIILVDGKGGVGGRGGTGGNGGAGSDGGAGGELSVSAAIPVPVFVVLMSIGLFH